ncbi:MAG: hypothetical protein ACE5F2_02835 [Candidatus Paceibacteria bacterium]
MEYSRKKWDKILDDISSKENIEYEFKPIDIRASKHHEDIWLEEVLVIKKLKN